MVIRALLSLLPIVFCTVVCVAQPLPGIEYDGGAPSHPFDVLHISLDVSFDFERSIVFGRVAHRIRSLNPSLAELRLDAAPEIMVSAMTVNGIAADFNRLDDVLSVRLPVPLRYNDTALVEIVYSVKPEKGLYFIKKNPGEPEGQDQIWTQGEGEDHHYWIPMYDYPDDLATTEVRATVRSDWQVLSNGALVSRSDETAGNRVWHYRMEKPHAGYLIMLAAGNFLVTRDTALNVPLEYWSYPEFPERVEPTFGRTPDMLRYFDSLLGVPYPWNKYAQVVVDRFMYGGMENTTATTLNDFCLVDGRGFLDYNPDELIAHELAHQWFGDLVTNRSWDHLWIHESFATYLAARYIGYRYGQEAYDRQMLSYSESAIYTDDDKGRSPIAGGKGHTASLYGRGAYVLHMLNNLLGEELFWRSIRLFLERNAHRAVETNDLVVAFKDATGYNLDWFFDQWIYGSGMPDMQITQERSGDSLRLIVAQVQPRDSLTLTFRIPLEIEILAGDSGPLPGGESPERRIEHVWLVDSVDTVTVALGSDPAAVIPDPGNYVMERLRFAESPSALLARFRSAESSVDRVLALRKIGGLGSEDLKKAKELQPDPYAVIGERFAGALVGERSPWIREEIMEAAAALRLANAPEILAAGMRDPERDVRKAAVENAWAIDDKELRLNLVRPLLADSSSDVVAESLRMLAVTSPEGLEEPLTRLQYVKGPREQTARAWMEAVAAGKFLGFTDRVAWYALNGTRFNTRQTAFETLGALSSTTPAVREAILAGLRDKSEGTFKSALGALKTHQDSEMKSRLDSLRNEISEDRWQKIEETM